jgi:dephospho-CoA kinase
MAMPLLLIAGIPASGKTYFSEWLESKKGFTYIDVDKDPSMRFAGLELEW